MNMVDGYSNGQRALAVKPAPSLRFCIKLIAAFAITLFSFDGGTAFAKSDALNLNLSVFYGQMTDKDWQESINPDAVGFRDSSLLGLALSRRLGRWFDGLELEIEAQAVRHFGDQEHWEFNLPLILRWQRMPFDNLVDTSVAFGLGLSYASRVPKVEVREEGSSKRLLVYWLGEIEAGPPKAPWRLFFRLHHRSEAYGLLADAGGANVLALGLRWRF